MDLIILSRYMMLLLIVHNVKAKEAICGTSNDQGSTCTCENFIMDCRSQNIDKFPTKIAETIEAIYLDDNDLKSLAQLPEEASLKTLSLKNNKIAELQYDTFDNLDSLTTLYLSNNSISIIADDIFEWNPLKLQVLHLDGNKMEFVQHFLFYDLEDLTTLHLQNNDITFIHPHAFLQLKSLRSLRLDGNKLHTFNPKWIQKLQANGFTEVLFDNNPWSCDCAMNGSLVWLKAEKKASWFRDLTVEHPIKCERPLTHKGKLLEKLEKSDLEDVCDKPVITGISTSASIAAGRDVLLRCVAAEDRYPVPTISWTAPNGDVYRLNTAGNFEGIVVHQDGALLIKNLSKSDNGEYSCEASNLKGSFTANTEIKVLAAPKVPSQADTAQYNVSANTPAGDGVEEKVAAEGCPKNCQCVSKHVDCAGDGTHPRNSLPLGIPVDAVSISFASNSLTSLTKKDFTKFKDLEELRLDDNRISTIESGTFDTLGSLTTLTLRKNELSSLRRTFKSLERLNVLVLDENKLNKIDPDTFEGLKKVHWLYIRNNFIQTIADGAFAPLKEIKFIHLEGNQLQVLYLPTITALTNMASPTINKIFVNDNNFVCDCNMEDLRTFILNPDTTSKHPNLFADGVVCSNPAEHADGHLEDIRTELVCTEQEDLQKYLDQHKQTQETSSYSGLLLGGIALGVVLTIVLFILWRKYGRRARTAGRAYNYSNLNGTDEAERRGLTTDNLGNSGTEAFV